MDLKDYRDQIDEIDDKMRELFEKRFSIIKNLNEYKKNHNLDILDQTREKTIIKSNLDKLTNHEIKEYYQEFIKEILYLSKEYQNKNR